MDRTRDFWKNNILTVKKKADGLGRPPFFAKACKRSCQWEVLCIPKIKMESALDIMTMA